jgi:short-subunit dehydrogenase
MSQHRDKGAALITGASSGIGAVSADRLARGDDLALVARDAPRLEHVAALLRAATGATSEVLRADLTQQADLARVEQRLRHDATITMPVNNAGVAASGPLVGGISMRLKP